MSTKKLFTPAQVVQALDTIAPLSPSEMLARGYIDIPAILTDSVPFEVILVDARDKKIQAIKEIRSLTSLGLAESKAIADVPNSVVLTTPDLATANSAARQLISKAGAVAKVQRAAA